MADLERQKLENEFDKHMMWIWEHIKMMCRHDEGLVLSDSEDYLKPLLAEGLPSEVWWGILWTITKVGKVSKELSYENDVLADIIRTQTSLAVDGEIRWAEMAEWYRALDDREVQLARSTLELAFEGTIPTRLQVARAEDTSSTSE